MVGLRKLKLVGRDVRELGENPFGSKVLRL